MYSDDLIEKIKLEITNPGFSYKRKSDVRKLVKQIGRALTIKDETVTINEQNALNLTLQKYVDLPNLSTKISEYDEALISHYGREKVSFSGGKQIDFSAAEDTVFKQITDRIYKNRCAMVHSKESDKSKFVPFKHDKDLLLEVPLMRFVAEDIIISSSELLT